jgi:hypothetical protein
MHSLRLPVAVDEHCHQWQAVVILVNDVLQVGAAFTRLPTCEVWPATLKAGLGAVGGSQICVHRRWVGYRMSSAGHPVVECNHEQESFRQHDNVGGEHRTSAVQPPVDIELGYIHPIVDVCACKLLFEPLCFICVSTTTACCSWLKSSGRSVKTIIPICERLQLSTTVSVQHGMG